MLPSQGRGEDSLLKVSGDARPADVKDRGGAVGVSCMNFSWLAPAAQKHAGKEKWAPLSWEQTFPF